MPTNEHLAAACTNAWRRVKLTLEARRRMQDVLTKLWREPSTQTVQAKRAIWVLERIGTTEARTLLRTLAEGSPDAWQTREARQALERLKQ